MTTTRPQSDIFCCHNINRFYSVTLPSNSKSSTKRCKKSLKIPSSLKKFPMQSTYMNIHIHMKHVIMHYVVCCSVKTRLCPSVLSAGFQGRVKAAVADCGYSNVRRCITVILGLINSENALASHFLAVAPTACNIDVSCIPLLPDPHFDDHSGVWTIRNSGEVETLLCKKKR